MRNLPQKRILLGYEQWDSDQQRGHCGRFTEAPHGLHRQEDTLPAQRLQSNKQTVSFAFRYHLNWTSSCYVSISKTYCSTLLQHWQSVCLQGSVIAAILSELAGRYHGIHQALASYREQYVAIHRRIHGTAATSAFQTRPAPSIQAGTPLPKLSGPSPFSAPRYVFVVIFLLFLPKI